jgi:PAS domain S-box-containing protein
MWRRHARAVAEPFVNECAVALPAKVAAGSPFRAIFRFREIFLMLMPIAQIPTPAVALDGKGLIYTANDAMARCLGTTASEMIATEFAGWAEDPDALRKFLRHSGAGQREFDFRAKGGGKFAMAISIASADASGGNLLLGFETTALRECERRYRAIFEVASDWFWETDAALRLNHLSPNFETAMGMPRRALLGKRCDEVADTTEDVERRRLHLATLAARRPFRDFVYRQAAGDGRRRWLKSSGVPMFDADGGFTGYQGATTDVTVYLEAEAAADRKRRDLEAELQHAQKLEALGALAGGVAHDLNNTLVPVIALAKIMVDKLPEQSRERRNLTTILEAGGRARDLVRQILAFTRKEAPTRTTVELSGLVRGSLKMLRASIPSTIQIDEAIAEVPPVRGDPGQIHQVMINLVVNAAQAIGEAPGKIAIELASAPSDKLDQARHPWTGPAVRLSVQDTGCGMDEVTIQRIFEPFFTTKAVGEGTGLGLSVVQGIIAQHGGRIAVDSRRGKGTRFDVYLPALSQEEVSRLGISGTAA